MLAIGHSWFDYDHRDQWQCDACFSVPPKALFMLYYLAEGHNFK